MPIYEYRCNECGHRLEELQRLSAPPLETCPSCGGGLTKLISAPAFRFKGSGWYATDYANKDTGGKSSADTESSASESSSSESSSSDGSSSDRSPSSASGSSASSKEKSV